MFRTSGTIKSATIILIFIVATFIAFFLLEIKLPFKLNDVFVSSHPVATTAKYVKAKCGLIRDCPANHFSFKMASGAANVVGPRICIEDKVLMSGVRNNVGRGINVALVNGKTGDPTKITVFDTWGEDILPFIKFLKEIDEGTVVMMASFDDASTKLNDEARKLIGELGSTIITQLGFRDSWLFVGGKGIKTKSPFEQHAKHNPATNKFDGWPEVLEMEGCIPKKA